MYPRRGRNRLLACSLPWLALVPLLVVSGCGQSYGDLSGTVTYEGKPVLVGSVLVQGKDGLTRTGVLGEKGAYSVPNVPTGPVKIAVTSPNPTTVTVRPSKKPGGGPPRPAQEAVTGWFAIPEDYADFDKSGLTHTLKTGQNKFDIDLKEKKEEP